MASGMREELLSCTGKVRFDTMNAARKVMQYRRFNKRKIVRQQAYRCPFCAGYHIGDGKWQTPRK